MSALWEQVPDVGCKGLCVESCHADVGYGTNASHDCARLVAGRCSVYEYRPMVCRLWGAVPEMPCPHGCEPTLSSMEGVLLMTRAQ